MDDLIELVFEYRSLLARSGADASGLTLPARHRLEALHRLLGREPLDDGQQVEPAPSGADLLDQGGDPPGLLGRRSHARCDVELSGLLRLGGELLPVVVLNLGAGGVCVSAPEPLAADQKAALRISSPETSRVYECVAEVTWSHEQSGGGAWLAGLRFVGDSCEVDLAS